MAAVRLAAARPVRLLVPADRARHLGARAPRWPPPPAPARFRLGTCGGAVLFVDGREVGWMAPYSRNLEAEAEFDVHLAAGANEIQVWFDDLAERDARYFIQLDYLAGPVGGASSSPVRRTRR